jgi:CheY-like chemotaxis protein
MKRIDLPKPQKPVVNDAPPPRKLVLYVEDDADNREVASARLGKAYQLLLAADDVTACRMLSEHGDKLWLVLMDIELKGSRLSGIDLARLIRGKLESLRRPQYAEVVPLLDVPIIFVTAYGKSYPRTDLILSGGGEVIDKPIDFVKLHTAMARQSLGKHG